METLGGVLLLAALVAVIWVVQRVMSKVGAAAEGAFTGNTKRRGKAAAALRSEFTAPVAGSQVVARALETLGISDGRKAEGLKVAGGSEDGGTVLIESSTPFMTHLTFAIDTDPADAGCEGYACAVQWQESEGHVTATETIERIHKHVRSAVEHFGGQVTEARN